MSPIMKDLHRFVLTTWIIEWKHSN